MTKTTSSPQPVTETPAAPDWILAEDAHGVKFTTDRGFTLFRLRFNGLPVEEVDAIHRLIAAAPELLAALEAALKESEQGIYKPSTIKTIESAITKAKGN